MEVVKCKHCGETYIAPDDNATCFKCGKFRYAPLQDENDIKDFFQKAYSGDYRRNGNSRDIINGLWV